MSAKITVPASEVWDYFQNSKQDLELHMSQIAENPEYGVTIFVTEEKGLPNIVVTADDIQVYEELTINADDCKETVAKIYDDYLTSKFFDSVFDNEEDELTAWDIEDKIDEREAELDAAVCDFMEIALQDAYYDDSSPEYDDIVDDLKEHFLEYMARKHGLPVYRPMMLIYEDGTEKMSDYPYEDMEFEDPDNPLYE